MTARVLESSGVTVVVRGVPVPPPELLARITPEPGTRTVVVAAQPPIPAAELGELLAGRLPVECTAIRLVLSYAGSDGLAPALATRLGLPVTAPTGPALILAGGLLHVLDGQWWLFRPGQRPLPRGPRHPAPAWQSALPPTLSASWTPIPAGLWLHGGTGTTPPAPMLAVPVDPARLVVLVSGVPVDAACTAITELPRGLRRRLVLIPYGPDSTAVHELAERLAVKAGVEADVAAGVPSFTGRTTLTTMDASGRRGWRPYGEWFVYRGGAAPKVRRGRGLIPGVAVEDGGVQRIGDGWVLEPVRAGWLIRADRDYADAEVARRVLPVAAYPLILLGAELAENPAVAMRVVRRVVEHTPPDIRSLLRPAVTRPPVDAGPYLAAYGKLLYTVGDGSVALLPGSRSSSRSRSSPALLSSPALPGLREEPVVRLKRPEAPAPPVAAEPEPTVRLVPAEPGDDLSAPAPESALPASTPLVTTPAPAPLPARLIAEEHYAAGETAAVEGIPARAGAYAARWAPPHGETWRPGGVYVAGETLAAGQAVTGAEFVVVWLAGARRTPKEPGTVRVAPGTRFVVESAGPETTLLREVAPGTTGTQVARDLRRTAQAWRRAPLPA